MSLPYNVQVDLALPKLKAAGQKQLFELLAGEISSVIQYPEQLLFKSFIQKEQKSSSSVGDGIAIPHMKLPGLVNSLVVIASLERPIKFNSPDDKPVDLIGLLVSPKTSGPLHLQQLSRLSRLLKNHLLCEKLRDASDSDAIRALIANPEGWLLAA